MALGRNERDLVSGVLFVAGGVLGLIASSRYAMGTATDMGPAYFPVLVFGALIIVGGIVVMRALLVDGERLESWAWRPLLVILASLAIFGLIVDAIGFIISSAVLIVLSTTASGRLSGRQIAALTVVLTALSAIIFVKGLRLPIPLWPRILM